jgi:hypothetical protein
MYYGFVLPDNPFETVRVRDARRLGSRVSVSGPK